MVLHCDFYSPVLKRNTHINVILPTPNETDQKVAKNLKVLYLLHGLSDDHSIWLRRTSIERYATQYGMYQFTDSVRINGYGPFDGNVCYKDYPSIVKAFGFNGYNSGKNPIGHIDSVTAVGPGKIRVSGWTMDEDALWTPLATHIYVGGGPGEANVDGYVTTADVYRQDIANAYPNAGGYHGFDVVVTTGKSGWQVVNVFGINEGGGDNTLLTNSGWIVDVPADTEQPVISDVQVTDVTAYGYTVTCTVSDNVAIRNVTMPTWTENGGQDDIYWAEATVFGDKATFNVSFSSHNYECGTYNTHIYANDLAGNSVCYPVIIEVPPVLTETPASGTVEENTYFIASSFNRNYVLDVSNVSMDDGANIHLWCTVGSGKNQMWKISDSDGDGYYTITSVHSGKVLDAAEAGTADGTNVQQYTYNGSDAQLWKLEENGDGSYRIINKNSGLSLDLSAGVVTNGQNIHLYSANDSAAQKWYIIPADLTGPQITDITFSEVTSEGFRVTCTVSDAAALKKVDFPAWTTSNGQDDQIWHTATISGNTATCYIPISDHNMEPGAYELHIYAYDNLGNCSGVVTGGVTVPNRTGREAVSGKLENGAYFVTSALNQNFAMEVAGASMDNSANVQLWETWGMNRNHIWMIEDTDGDGYYTVAALHSGKYLDVLGGTAVSDTNVQQYEATNTDAQLWRIVPNEDGTYSFYSKCGGYALDLDCGVVSSGTNIRIHDVNGAPAQKWSLIPADTTGPMISDVQFSEITAEGFRITCTVEDASALQSVEFPTWTTNNGNDELVWHKATISGNTATCYISIGDHNLESGAYEVHIYAYDIVGNLGAIVTNGVTIPNRIGNAPAGGTLKNGTYFIATAQNQNFVVDVEGVSVENGANIYLWETAGNNQNQMWQISDEDGDGYYTVVALHSGKYLDVAGGVAASGTNVQQYEATYSDAQLWLIAANEDGTYSFYSKCGGFALDLAWGVVSNGTNIGIHDINGFAAQKWYLIPAKLTADTTHIHTYLTTVVTAPTCGEAGYTTHTCANCGESFVTDEVAALGHSYENGSCTVCGETDPDYVAPVTVTAKSFSLSFEDEILVNYYYAVSDMTDVVEQGMLVFYEAPIAADIAAADEVYTDSVYAEALGWYMNTTTGIAAKRMGDSRYYAAYVKLADGSYVYSGLNEYSPKKYAYNMLGKSDTSEKQKILCVAMLNYGAAAQEYFGYNADALINAALTAEQKAMVAAYDASFFAGAVAADSSKTGNFVKTEGFTSKSASVSFEGAFAINYYFTPSAAVAGDVTMYIWTPKAYAAAEALTADNAEPVTMAPQSDGSYWAQINGIAAKHLDETYYVAAVYTDAEGNTHCTGVIAYSLSKYCINNAVEGKAMQSLAANTAMYGYYAKLYFNKQ